MSYISRIGILCLATAGLFVAACDSDKAEDTPTEAQQSAAPAESKPAAASDLQSDQERYSYTIGYQIGSSLRQRLEDIDADKLAQGVREALTGAEPKLQPEEMQSALQGYQEMQTKKVQDRMQAAAAEGTAFLEANRAKEGVKETDSGLQYEVLQAGTGPQPGPNDTVEVNYRGTLLDGTEFDSSYARGESATLPVSGVIPGWQEALQMMKVGGKWKIYVPPQLAYGEQGAGDVIGPNQTLVFEIELLSIKNAQGAGDADTGSEAQPSGDGEQAPTQPQESDAPAQ